MQQDILKEHVDGHATVDQQIQLATMAELFDGLPVWVTSLLSSQRPQP
jgi:hypothetical protein